MAKIMVSMNDELEEKMRAEIKKLYHGRVGGLSIFFERLVRDYFKSKQDERRPR